MTDEELIATLESIEADIDQMLDIVENPNGESLIQALENLERIMARVEMKSLNLENSIQQAHTKENSLQKTEFEYGQKHIKSK